MYGKLFDSMYDGTLAEDWRALITFQQFIILCDADGVVDMKPTAISRRTGIPIEHIKAGIEILQNPDPDSRTEGEEGRRIRLLDEHRTWGWYIVNHAKYRSLQDNDTVRAQNRERKRRQREKSKESRMVTDGHAPSRHTDTDTINNSPNFEEFWTNYPRREGKAKAQKAFNNLPKKDQQALIDHMPARLKHESFDQPKKYIPLPATFINGRRWEDELTAEAKSNLSSIRDLDL